LDQHQLDQHQNVSFSFAALIRQHALVRPEAPALTFEGTTQTYRQLNDASSRVANALLAEGVAPGDRVAVLSKNTPEFFEIAFACSKIGAVLVGLNWRLAGREIEAIAADATPKLIIASQAEGTLLTDTVRNHPTLQRVIELGRKYDSWRDAATADDPTASYSAQPNDVCLILYTSGTTGLPKGVMLTNEGMSFSPRIAEEAWGFDDSSVNLVAMPMFHIGGIGYGSSAFCSGGHTVLMRDVDPALILRTMADYRVTHAFFVPAVINLLLNTPDVQSTDLSSLGLVVYGASPISDAVLRQAISVFGCGFMQAYGMTETSGTVVSLPRSDHDPDGPRVHLLRACGLAFPWTEVRLIDPKTMSDAALGDVGEIWLRSGQVMKGYWGNPHETAHAITADGWLRTGDAAYMDAEGYLFLFDRFKDMIVSGAENIYPAEVENVLQDHPAVREVAVIGVPSERWGETVKAIVVLKDDMHADELELINFSRERIAKYKCPTSVDFTDVLPRNASGKLLKKDLRSSYWQGFERAVN
jgi:acyl-CoA synthetase (AMP-forming)/AMP-acid ligase II